MQLAGQDELDFHELRATDWFFVKKLLEDLQRDFAKREKFLIMLTSRFVMAVDLFRMCEQVVILDNAQPSKRDQSYHKGVLLILAGLGTLLLEDLRNNEEIDIKKALGFTFQDLSAIVSELEMDVRMHHGDMTAARREAILADCFGDESTR